MIVWPSWRSGSRSSTAPRICDTSISMCTWVGVPSVRTTWLAAAASWIRPVSRSRPAASTRPRRSSVPVSWKGIRPSCTSSSTRGSRSTPITSRPRSAKESASGSPILPSPTIATVSDIGPEATGRRSARPDGALPTGARRREDRTAAALGHELLRRCPHEARVVVQVARQQAPWLLGDAVGPLQAPPLHPGRRLRDPPGVEVERRADRAHDRDLEPVAHPRHPLLLLGHADSDPQHVGTRGVDLLRQLVLLRPGERAEGR